MNLGRRILVSSLAAVIVAAAAGAQSVPAVSSAEARKAIEAGYIEWAKARVALHMNTIGRMLAPDFYFQLPDRKLTRQEFIDRMQLFCVGNQIATHQSEPVFKAQFIFSLVVVAEIAPISA